MAKYDPASYRIYLRVSINSKNKHILVEGKDDKYLIQRLCQDFLAKNGKCTTDTILVDSAENLTKEDELAPFLNNRQKVEYIANSVIGKPYADSFIGFVDRELDKFKWDYDCNSELQDTHKSHDVIQRLVLSRGHSIENYIFDLSILCEVLEVISTTNYANPAIKLFRETFYSTLRVACSVGLAATKSQVLTKANSTIGYSLLEIVSPPEVVFKFDEWVRILVDRGISIEQEQSLRSNYTIYNEQVSRASIFLIRWICHGHIGYNFLKALYERCLLNVCPSIRAKEELTGISWVAKEKLFYSFINCWIKKSLEEGEEECDYPTAIFELLGLIS